jgi:hypothetical protein
MFREYVLEDIFGASRNIQGDYEALILLAFQDDSNDFQLGSLWMTVAS